VPTTNQLVREGATVTDEEDGDAGVAGFTPAARCVYPCLYYHAEEAELGAT
jgi:hypothetical protein